jgi:hypothetical protein
VREAQARPKYALHNTSILYMNEYMYVRAQHNNMVILYKYTLDDFY